ncbi:extensin family protein [Pseudophaeobacter sp. EL27]|uniref:extensin-like domain-containing protein n=1 Tax=Pseudophaeobacter sp. EL27 TaxID=2107580 RepID=UPI000EFA575E|nr:extensin family protein [Pseudophaeobacter sp. EL27]
MIGLGRIRSGVLVVLAAGVLSVTGIAPLNASAPEVSLRPIDRASSRAVTSTATLPQSSGGALADLEQIGLVTPDGLRPVVRPVSAQILAAAALPVDLVPSVLDQSLVPFVRPDTVVEQALFKRRRQRKGSVCGDIEIQGKAIGAVEAAMPGCGASDAVRVTSVAGVTLSQGSVMTCEMAEALKNWVSKDVETAFGRRNKVVSLRVAAHYACRTRNNRPGGRISEHGRGKAIDISGFKLEDGTLVTVLEGWTSRETRKPMRRIWKAACGPFGTVLGPEADRYHRDHFHVDVARHRGGPYCR